MYLDVEVSGDIPIDPIDVVDDDITFPDFP